MTETKCVDKLEQSILNRHHGELLGINEKLNFLTDQLGKKLIELRGDTPEENCKNTEDVCGGLLDFIKKESRYANLYLDKLSSQLNELNQLV